MPTYEYVCEKCGHEFDKFQLMADKPLTACPKDVCPQKKWGKGKVKKMISAGAGLIFKGSGFYITDYRSESYKDAAKKDASASSSSSPSTSGDSKTAKPASSESKPASSESKPAAKTEAKPAKPSKSKD